MPVSRSSPIPLYIQIEQKLREDIEGGQLGTDDRIPAELELADAFGVSRMTARKAVDRLVSEGLLFRQPGKGTFVAQPKIAHGLSTQLSFSSAMDSLGLAHTTEVLQAELRSAPPHVARALDLPNSAATVYLRRLRSVAGEPAAVHTSYLPGLYAGILEMDLEGSLTRAMDSAGARVTSARDAVEAITANREVASLLGVAERSPLIRIEGVAYSSSGDPLRWTEAIYRGDRFRFTVDTSKPADLRLELVETAAS